ncbi:uncharacterized protein ARMOST_14578 [Armillaria ostoyae]|uniref:Uncharacterized protein n=1 Tax=Armillaria ostoyae TaxID=47428 RepID=A0A284RR56_ARMOS|nr:uncharacterized protein ARMOST_14578 [Armillaria ostoyae]
MTLVSAKSGDSSLPQDTQNDLVFHPSVSTPPRWPGFYQQPIENDIIDGTDWIDSLWAVLHRTDFCRSTGCFVSTSRKLGEHVARYHTFKFSFIWLSHIQTKTLYTIYDIIEYRGYLESVCPGLINDVLREIGDNGSDTMAFSDDLRRRCKTAGPELERKMSMLQAIVIRQHRDFNPKTFVKTINYLRFGAYVILYCITLPLLFCLVASESSSASTTCLGYIGVISVYAITTVSEIHPPACELAQEVDSLNANTFQLIWAVRNVAGLLTLIAESEGSPMSDMLHAKLFLEAFQFSVCHNSLGSFYYPFGRLFKFLGGRQELLDLRSWLQELPSWTDKNFGAHHWNDHDVTSPRDNSLHYIPYQAPATRTRSIFPCVPRFSSIAVTRIYQKVFGRYSRSDLLPTTSSRQVEHQKVAATNTQASDTARVPVSTSSGIGLSRAIFRYSRSAAEDYV